METVCVGISGKSIECLLSEGGSALWYVCCSCRFKSRSCDSPKQEKLQSDSFSQMLEMIGALAGQVRALVSRLDSCDRNETLN